RGASWLPISYFAGVGGGPNSILDSVFCVFSTVEKGHNPVPPGMTHQVFRVTKDGASRQLDHPFALSGSPNRSILVNVHAGISALVAEIGIRFLRTGARHAGSTCQ